MTQTKSFDFEKAKLRWKQGWSRKQIADEQGISPAQVHYRLSRAGLSINRMARLQARISQANELAARIQKGETRADIAKDLGISRERAGQIIELVIPRRPKEDRDNDWSPGKVAQLRKLWDEGHSTSEIGRRMGLTKNQVIGKARRLDLTERGSPINPKPDYVPATSPEVKKARSEFTRKQREAKARGISFVMTFDEWWNWWQTDNRWARRWRGKGAIRMARIDNTGPIAIGNVREMSYSEFARESGYGKLSGQRLIEYSRINGHPAQRAVLTPRGRFDSIKKAAKAYDKCVDIVRYWAKNQKNGFSFAED